MIKKSKYPQDWHSIAFLAGIFLHKLTLKYD
jgi:hypothetical protein